MTNIKITNLTVRFGTSTVLNDLSFTFKASSHYHLYGPNGAGKSTLLKSLSHVIIPTAGEIKFGSFKLNNEDNFNHNIGYLSSNSQGMFSRLTGEENIQLFANLNKLNPNNLPFLKEFLSIKIFKEAYGKKVFQSSTGMKRLLLIYLSLIKNPEILLWDEPFVGLAPEVIKWLEEFIERKLNKKVLIVCSHQEIKLKNLYRVNINQGKLSAE